MTRPPLRSLALRPSLARPARALIAAAVLLAGGLSCAQPMAPGDGVVQASATAAGVVATNHGAQPAHYLAYTPGWLALVLLAPCRDDDQDPCPRLAPGATITIPWSQVGGYPDPSRQYRLSWSLVGSPAVRGEVELTAPAGVP